MRDSLDNSSYFIRLVPRDNTVENDVLSSRKVSCKCVVLRYGNENKSVYETLGGHVHSVSRTSQSNAAINRRRMYGD